MQLFEKNSSVPAVSLRISKCNFGNLSSYSFKDVPKEAVLEYSKCGLCPTL